MDLRKEITVNFYENGATSPAVDTADADGLPPLPPPGDAHEDRLWVYRVVALRGIREGEASNLLAELRAEAQRADYQAQLDELAYQRAQVEKAEGLERIAKQYVEGRR